MGDAFDIVAERVRSDYLRVSDRVHRTSWKVTLRNHKEEDVVVEVVEQRQRAEVDVIDLSTPAAELAAALG